VTTTDIAAERYRRRRRWPILVVAAVLLVGAGVVWFQVLKPVAAAATGCNPPGTVTTTAQTSRTSASPSTAASGRTPASTARSTARSTAASTPAGTTAPATTLGTFVANSTLRDTRPANPEKIVLQVYNSSATRGLAKTVTTSLRAAGFSSIKDAANDTLYPAADLTCNSEIRFGPAGSAQARTVLIVAPCAQLVMDNRIDTSVDLALGGRFSFIDLTDEEKAQLTALIQAAAPPPVIEGQTQAARPLASIPPLPNADCSGTATTRATSAPSSTPSSGAGVSGSTPAGSGSAPSSGSTGLPATSGSTPTPSS
jgi:hypothetical protein